MKENTYSTMTEINTQVAAIKDHFGSWFAPEVISEMPGEGLKQIDEVMTSVKQSLQAAFNI